MRDGSFAAEIALTVRGRKGDVIVGEDEEPGRCDIERIPTMRPAFAAEGTVTAATSSSISDGAAALLVMSESEAKRRGITPLARIVANAAHAREPEWFTRAPGPAVVKALKIADWRVTEVDLFEINEAFACVAWRRCGSRYRSRPGQRCRRRLRAGPSDRRVRSAAARHADPCTAPAWRPARSRLRIGGGEAVATAIELIWNAATAFAGAVEAGSGER